MSAAAALKLAEAAGIDIIVDGPNLLLEAPATPSPAVVAEIKRNKAAIIELLRPAGSGAAVPAEWIAGLNKLRTVDHFPGFSAEQWRQLCESGAAFLERWGATADKLGWNEIDIFGVIRSLGSRGPDLASSWAGGRPGAPDTRWRSCRDRRRPFDDPLRLRFGVGLSPAVGPGRGPAMGSARMSGNPQAHLGRRSQRLRVHTGRRQEVPRSPPCRNWQHARKQGAGRGVGKRPNSTGSSMSRVLVNRTPIPNGPHRARCSTPLRMLSHQ